jgi:O-antigen ligase
VQLLLGQRRFLDAAIDAAPFGTNIPIMAVLASKSETLIPSNWFSSLTLFVTVAAAPFPFGSQDPAAIAFWCIVLGLGVVAASLRGLRREHFALLALAVAVILGYAFVLHEQLAVRPWIASPHPLWHEAAKALGAPLVPSVSIARNQPLFALGAPLANMLAVICSFIVCINRDRAHQLLLVIAWSGAAYAIYGIAAYLINPTFVLWREKDAYGDVLTSTFINRNTAAVYFGSCAVLWLLLLLRQLRHSLPHGSLHWRSVLHHLLASLPRRMVLSFAMLILCLAAMMMTNSRAGVVISLLALVVAFVCLFHRDLPRRGGIVAALAVGGLSALLLLQVLGGNVSGRFAAQGLSDEGRLETYRSTLRMIGDHPWFGTGIGTFAWSFPAYRSDHVSMWGVWDRAHSTPLELASEVGLPLAGLICLVWLMVLLVLIRGVRIRRRDLIVPVAALAVAILGLTHSIIDFSLQIPGYAIPVFALVGAGLAQSFGSQVLDSPDNNDVKNKMKSQVR